MPCGVKIINVECQCGQKIARYKKDKKGFLVKMYLDRILEDFTGRLIPMHHEIDESIFCQTCGKRIAIIKRVKGRLAAKINHGAVKKIST